jgi:proline dehydrogenase
MRRLFRPLYNVLTAGETISSLEATIQTLKSTQVYPIADYIREYAKTDNDVNKNVEEYKKLAHARNLEYIAIKPSSFCFKLEPLYSLIGYMIFYKKKILIDAEDVVNQTQINYITDKIMLNYNIETINIYKTYQMYRRDSLKTLEHDMNRFSHLGIKLVRGAYMKQDKHTGILFDTKAGTDKAFRAALDIALQSNHRNIIHTMICTHNKDDIHYMINKYKNQPIVHASLYGFLPNDTHKIVKSGIPTYKYLPYGSMEDAVPYLMRRIQENPLILKYYFT